MYGLFGKLRSVPGQRAALLALLQEGLETLQALEGCYHYIIGTDPQDTDGIWISEVWRSQADHQGSLAHEGIRQVINRARPLIADMPAHFEYTPVDGKGLPPLV